MSDSTGDKIICSEQQGNVLVITPLFTQAAFTEPHNANQWHAVEQQLDSPGTEQVIVDLGEIPYFGSTVLEWITQLWKRIKTKGGRLAVVRPSKIGREVLSVARLERLWGIFDTRDQAISWLAKPQT
ncbi:MAG TPA: STAS domain-containing protein [Pirellulaceae bacterium]|jgi:anti-anti-sigma factor